MGFGTSLGTSHEDEMSYVLDTLTPKQKSDQAEIDSNTTSGDFRSRFDVTVPPGSLRELAGALKHSALSQTPEKPPETKPDYDYESWQKANPGVEMAPGQHYPDTYKLPNHITFSDESMYHKGEDKGGHWGTDEQGRDTFTPGSTNLKNYSMEELQDYFKRVEPNAVLLPPGTSYVNPPERSQEPSIINRPSIINAVKGMLKGPNLEEDKKILTGFYDTVKGAFGLPGDVYGGKIDPMSDQGIEKSFDLASLMVFGPAPVAAKMADGTLGSFMGVKSRTFDRTKLSKAQEMEMNSMHPDDIWQDTGTFRGADGRWRQEINDKHSNLKEEHLNVTETVTDNPTGWTSPKNHGEVTKTVSIPGPYEGIQNANTLEDLLKSLSQPRDQKVLGHILYHPTLYNAYPWLQNIKVYPLAKDSPYYGMAKGGNEIHMAELSPETFHSTLMHEVQHLIQTHEGFAQGSNANMFIPKELHAAEENFIKIRDEALANTERELGNATRVGEMQRAVNIELEGNAKPGTIAYKRLSFLKEKHPEIYERLSNIAKSEKLLREAKEEAKKKYLSTMGEVEARNVQARIGMTATERFLNSPQSTESTIMARELQHDPYATGIPTLINKNMADIRVPDIGKSPPAFSRRWPNNDNVRPLNESEAFLKDWDALHEFGQKMNLKSETDIHKYNKMGREMAKKHGQTWEDIPFNSLK